MRKLAYRLAIVSAGLILLTALFAPLVIVVFLAGGFAPQAGSASLFRISPGIGTAAASAIVLAIGAALIKEPRGRWLMASGVSLLGLCVLSLVYTYSPIAAFGFHPGGVGAVALGGLLLLAAGFSRGDSLNRA